tara:strand:- start:77653 stop:78339 length:687 start_codon:yes stop_codon:yes gene_type:complete
MIRFLIPILLCCFLSTANAEDFKALFNGQTLDGWHSVEDGIWRVEDGMIMGGSLNKMIEHNTFLVTDESYQNFELLLSFRLLGTEGFVNSGFQVRSIGVPGHGDMSGYQVDAGDGWWGKLYDESRRNTVIAESSDMAAVNKAVKRGEWNDYRILCEGRRIRSWVNGIPALDYTEMDQTIPQDGHIGIQAHGDGVTLIQIKAAYIKKLPDTPHLPKWSDVDLQSVIRLN